MPFTFQLDYADKETFFRISSQEALLIFFSSTGFFGEKWNDIRNIITWIMFWTKELTLNSFFFNLTHTHTDLFPYCPRGIKYFHLTHKSAIFIK